MQGVAVVVCVALTLALTLADKECGSLQRINVQRQWAQIYSVGEAREKFATRVWQDFFRRHREEIGRFERVNGYNIYSADFQGHMLRVFAGLDLLIGVLNDEPVFKAALAHYTDLHVKLGVNSDLVKEFGRSMGNVLPEFLSSTLAVDAWRPCFRIIAAGIAEGDNSISQGDNSISQEDAPKEKKVKDDNSANEILEDGPADEEVIDDPADQVAVDQPPAE